jgi:hypothetical protein
MSQRLPNRACKPLDFWSMITEGSHTYSIPPIPSPFPRSFGRGSAIYRSPCRSLHENIHTRLQNAHITWATHPYSRTFTVAYAFQNGYIVRAFRKCRPFIAKLFHEKACSRWRRFQSSILSRTLNQGEPRPTRLHFPSHTSQRLIRQRLPWGQQQPLHPSKSL